jgi:hypothetical protein
VEGNLGEFSTAPSLLCFWLLCSEEAEGLAKRLKLRFYRTSVKEDLNVSEGKYCSPSLRCFQSASSIVRRNWIAKQAEDKIFFLPHHINFEGVVFRAP